MTDELQSNSRKVLNQLHGLTRVIDSAGDQILHTEMGLGFSQFKILAVLKEKPMVPQVTVAKRLNLTAPAISRHIEAMLAKQLLTTMVNPKNRREHLLNLTPIGEDTLKVSWDLLDTRFKAVIKILNKKEQEQLIRMLDQLFRQLLIYKK